jgi:hypothetical protein
MISISTVPCHILVQAVKWRGNRTAAWQVAMQMIEDAEK